MDIFGFHIENPTAWGTGIAFAIVAATSGRYFAMWDRMEQRIRDNWKDSWFKRAILLTVKPCPSADEASRDS